jgi:hypothetical protein
MNKVVFVTVIILVLAFSGCPNETNGNTSVKVTGVNLFDTNGFNSGTIYLNGTGDAQPSSVTLVATVVPTNATNKAVVWTVENDDSTFINWNESSRTISAKAAGDATVTVTTKDGSFSKSYTVTVIDTDQAILVNTIDISAEGNKTGIIAGDGGNNAPETLQFTAEVSPSSASNKAVTWSVSDTSTYSASTTAAGGGISATGLLTAAATLANETDIWVFASATDGSNVKSAGTKITVKPYSAGPQEPVIYNFSTGDLNKLPTSNFTEVLTVEGLTFGTGSNLLAQSAGIDDYSFTHCLRTNGGASATQRYIVVPLNGPATVTIYGASNNNTATSMNITSSVESTTNIANPALPLPAWNTGLGKPTYTSTTTGAHTIVLKSAASARIFLIRVDYQ